MCHICKHRRKRCTGVLPCFDTHRPTELGARELECLWPVPCSQEVKVKTREYRPIHRHASLRNYVDLLLAFHRSAQALDPEYLSWFTVIEKLRTIPEEIGH